MKISAQEEYGLRLLIKIASCGSKTGASISQLSESEGLTSTYVAKLTRLLRIAGFINSTPGNKGGYVLARNPEEIIISDVLRTLGGTLYNKGFCESHSGSRKLCTQSVECSVRSLWQMVQYEIDKILKNMTLKDLVASPVLFSSAVSAE